jgi:hypothetical protein
MANPVISYSEGNHRWTACKRLWRNFVLSQAPSGGRKGGQRFFDFIEQPLFLFVASIIGGIVGVTVYTPVFAICVICILLALHRSKALSGLRPIAQAGSYILTFALSMTILVWVGHKMRASTSDFISKIIDGVAQKIRPTIPEQSREQAPNAVAPPKPLQPQPKPKSRPPQTALPPSDDPSVARIRADVTGLIYIIYSSLQELVKSEDFWRSTKSQGAVNTMIPAQQKAFAKDYEDKYRKKVVDTRQVLISHIRHLTPNESDMDPLYVPEDVPPGWTTISQNDVQNQLCDLRALLNELEKENNMELSGGDLILRCF